VSNHANTKVLTRAIGIKCSMMHQPILCKLFSQIFTAPTPDSAHIQLSLIGIPSLIGIKAYQNLLHENNKYFVNLASIPINGITQNHLETDIHVVHADDPNKCMTLCDIILANEWCSTIKVTQTLDHIIIVTQLSEASQWIDKNLEVLYCVHLSKNSCFQPSMENAIPYCTNHIRALECLATYANKLKTSIPLYKPEQSGKDTFSIFPAQQHIKTFQFIFDLNQFPELYKQTKTIKQKAQTDAITSITSAITTAPSQQPTVTPTTHHLVNLKAIQEEIKCNLSTDFTKLIQAKLASFQADMCSFMAKLNTKYNNLSHAVALLSQQFQQQHQVFTALQNNHPSSLVRGDGHS